MSINKDARKRAERYMQELADFKVSELNQMAGSLKAERGQRVKGGGWKRYRKAELVKSIRRVVGRGTFAGTLHRFADLADKFVEERLDPTYN
jgi:hypothetical protein